MLLCMKGGCIGWGTPGFFHEIGISVEMPLKRWMEIAPVLHITSLMDAVRDPSHISWNRSEGLPGSGLTPLEPDPPIVVLLFDMELGSWVL